jgi:hypothetical protein
MDKQLFENILKILSEEAKRIKKKKKKSLVSTPILTRPMGSMFFMDAGVSENLSESRSIIKPITKKFDHLKWPLTDFQKQFLDDFINVPDSSLRNEDFKYASNRTGIPVENLKSIKNTLSDIKTPEAAAREALKAQKELGLSGADLKQEVIDQANTEFASGPRDLPTEKEGRQWSMNPNPHFRNMTPGETLYKSKHGDNGGVYKKYERELPGFMYEWLQYFIEGSGDFKINESKLMNDFHSDKFQNYKFVLFSFDDMIKESGAHPYDIASNTKVNTIQQLEKKVKEFNESFGTNFVVSNQYTGEDGFLKVVFENAQLTDGNNIYNREFLDMADNDIKKAISLGFYSLDSTIRSIT